MPKIIIQHPDGQTVKYGLNGRIFTIGRADSNDIVLQDDASSSNHAVLKLTDSGDFMLTDLGSTNMTLVNGEAVTSRLLQNGDVLQFADSTAAYESDVQAYHDDQATQIYERPALAVQAITGAEPAGTRGGQAVGLPRPVSRRYRRSEGDGCFTAFTMAVALPALFLAGLAVRHFQDFKGQWFWDFVKTYIYGEKP